MQIRILYCTPNRKYGKIYNNLINSKRIESWQFFEPKEIDETGLQLIHPNSYLKKLNWSSKVAWMLEVPFVAFIPNLLGMCHQIVFHLSCYYNLYSI